MTSVLLVGCNLRKTSSGSNPGSGSGSGPFTISGTVTGLASGSAGLVLQDNATDSLTVTGKGPFTFKTAIVSGNGYNVSISTPPSSSAQTCTVLNGNGIASSNVTTVQVACATGSGNIISGQVTGLLGSGLVLQDNGVDNLPVIANGGFNFVTTIANGSTYKVTVLAQPSNPAQTCTVANGTGTANGNVGTVEAVERELILQTLASTNNKARAAELLGISLKTLHNKSL